MARSSGCGPDGWLAGLEDGWKWRGGWAGGSWRMTSPEPPTNSPTKTTQLPPNLDGSTCPAAAHPNLEPTLERALTAQSLRLLDQFSCWATSARKPHPLDQSRTHSRTWGYEMQQPGVRR